MTLNQSLVVLLLFLCTATLAAAESDAPAQVRTPTRIVTVGFYLHAIREVDWDNRSFVADIYWWLRYPKPDDEQECEQIEAVEFVNAHAGDIEQKTLERKIIQTEAGDEIYVHFRTVAPFFFSANFTKYPFDAQTLPIVLEHETLSNDDLTFAYDQVSDATPRTPTSLRGVSQNLQVPDFQITYIAHTVGHSTYYTNFGDASLDNTTFKSSRLTVALTIRRESSKFLVKMMIPLGICLVLPYLVFYVPAVELEVASGLTVSSLLTCVAIQIAVVPGLPQVGYLVVSDLFFYLSYALAMLAMAETVWSYQLEHKGNTLLANRMDRICRFLYPAFFLLGCLAIARLAT